MTTNGHNNRFNIKNVRGITLVEMIVVLVILGIIASTGIYSAVGYMRRATYDQNQKNAETIYQAAQTALQQMTKAGGIYSNDQSKVVPVDDWIKNKLIKSDRLFALESADDFDSLTESNANANPNKSVHTGLRLFYSKKSETDDQSKLVKDIIQPYFYDSTIFQGAIILELDVEKSADAYGKIHYSAKCLAVYYDSRANGGWDAVPSTTGTLIGYKNGYKASSVDTVYLPKVQEGIVLKKFQADQTTEYESETTEEGEEKLYEKTHTWITWAATLDRENLVGSKKDVYYRIVLTKNKQNSKVLILNEDFLTSADSVGNAKNSFDYKKAFDENNTPWTVKVDKYPVVYNPNSSNKFTKEITKKSVLFTARVYIKGLSSGDDKDGYKGAEAADITTNTDANLLPLKVTYVKNEYDSKDPDHAKPEYIEYSLDITELLDSDDDLDGAKITIHPNYFSKPSMNKVNDDKGIISLKKGASVEIDEVPPRVQVTPTPVPTPPQEQTP